jgi:ribosomal protein S27E
MKITCSQCGEVISEAEIEREENSKIIYCHQDGIRIDNVCCEECGNDLVDVDIEIEITTD